MKNFTITSLFSLLILFGFVGSVQGQTVIATEDFDSGTPAWANDIADQTFVDPSTSGEGLFIEAASSNNANFSGNYVHGIDLEGESDEPSLSPFTFTFEAIDVSGYSNVELSFDYAVFANADAGSYEVIIDGVGQGSVEFYNDPDAEFISGRVTVFIGTASTVALELTGTLNGGSDELELDNFLLAESSIKPEPANHVTGFEATPASISQIDLSWTDANSGTLPENYLILINETGSFTAPSDGTAQSDDIDLSDGSGALNIAQGQESASFSNLEVNTNYYFEIYPYTNSADNIDYKIDGTIPSDDVTTLEAPDFVLNEILADPAGSAAGDLEGDANGDGTRSSDDDEFLEFVNTGSSNLDISDWVISDETADRYTFPSSTILKPLQAIVIFGGGTPTGDFGNSIVKTTSSLGLSNGGEQITVKDDQGNTLIQVTYSGADDQSETRNPDLTGAFTDHSDADTEDNSLFSPGTRIDGTYFQPSVEISGDAGWRMLSFPISGGTVSDISDNTAIQGITGGPEADAASNFKIYDNNGVDFSDPTDISTSFGDGYGFITFFYNNSSGLSTPLPITLDAFGDEPSSEVSVDLNKTTLDGGSYYTLAGNPFNSNYDLSEITVTDGAIQNNVQFWDNSVDSYVTGDRATSFITASWQGFWVEVADGNGATSIEFPVSGKTETAATGTYFSKKNNAAFDISFELSSENTLDKAIRLSFREDAELGWDLADASKLVPLVSTTTPYATMAFVQQTEGEQVLKSVESLPLNLEEEQELMLEPSISGMDGTFTLEWAGMENIPEEWSLTFHDYETGESMDMNEVDSYSFVGEANVVQKTTSIITLASASTEKAKAVQRFGITVNPQKNVVGIEPGPELPEKFSLEQNYPNPFNPTTSIKYAIAESGPVTLEVFNVVGQKVATLIHENKSAGTYQLTWDASDMASGIYYYRLQSANVVLTRKMTLIK